jgi:hypothetical protein
VIKYRNAQDIGDKWKTTNRPLPRRRRSSLNEASLPSVPDFSPLPGAGATARSASTWSFDSLHCPRVRSGALDHQSRELRRNASSPLGYMPYGAHRAAAARRPRPRICTLQESGPLRDYVTINLQRRRSPEQISHRLRKDFSHDAQMRAARRNYLPGNLHATSRSVATRDHSDDSIRANQTQTSSR